MEIDIRTEVDHLIGILEGAPGRMFTIPQLAKLTGMKEPTVKKWLHVLEGKKRVKITYSLTKVEAAWIGQSLAIPIIERRAALPPQLEPQTHVSEAGGPSFYSISEHAKTARGQAVEKYEDLHTAQTLEEEFRKKRILEQLKEEKQKLLEQIGRKTGKKHGEEKLPVLVEVKPEEKTGMKISGEVKEKSAEKYNEREIEAASKELEAEATGETKQFEIDQTEFREFTPEIASRIKIDFGPPLSAKLPKPDLEVEKFSGKLAAHMAKISSKAKEIEKLKSEKKRILREIYEPLESRVQGDLEEVSERILDHETRMLKLREHVASLPSQISEVAERQEKMASVAREMQTAYEETDSLIEQSLVMVEQAKEIAQQKGEEIRGRTAQQEFALKKVHDAADQLSQMQAEAEGRLESARTAIEAQQQSLASTQTGFAALTHAKEGVEAEMQAMHSEIRRQHSVLSDLDAHVGRLDKIRGWVKSHKHEYAQKMKELADYMQNGEAEYSKVKEAVESNFVRRYLKELRAISESYEFELSQAQTHEKDIDREMDRIKGELSALIEEGKRLAELHEMQLGEEEGGGKPAQMMEARQAMFGSFEAGRKKQEKIRQYIRGAISGKGKEKKTGKKSRRKP